MTDDNNKIIEEKLALLRESYFAALPEKLSHIQQLWHDASDSSDNQDYLKQLQYATHTLSGSGATFGAKNISRLAKEIELKISDILQDGSEPSKTTQQLISDLIADLQSELNNTVPDKKKLTINQLDNSANAERPVYIVEDDAHLAEKIATELMEAKFEVEVFSDLESFKAVYKQNRPVAVILDIVFPDNDEGGASVMQSLLQVHHPAPPVLYMSSRSDIQARLAAVRAGASRYFIKPLNTEQLVSTLGGLTNRLPHIPYRVMIVDDDRELADYYATLLHSSGILVNVITDPLQALETLENWQPDLVVMDVYMPECNGLELASIIRQDDKYTTLPIVFLSSEMDINKQLYALDLGGDAFLTKPVDQQQLLSTVIARVKRSRWLIRLKNDLEMSLLKNESQKKEIEKKEERLRSSQFFAGIGTWDLNLHSQDMYWSEKISPLLGYKDGAMAPSYDAFMAAIHPEDKQRVVAAIESCASKGEEYEVEHRIIWPDGSVRWLTQKGNVIRNSQGVAIRMLGAIQDTTRRKQLEKDLATQKEFAVQANSAKSEFLSRMSHELRTPLNAIIGFTQLLEADTDPPLAEHQYDSLNEILRAANHLLELIDEVLDLAKIEAGKIQLNIEDMPIGDVLLESYSMMIPMAEKNSVQLEFNMKMCNQINISTDRTKLKQVIFNLISNAIKYNKPDGMVMVSCEAKSEYRVRINVTDTGKGIPRERQSELFKAFSRLGAERSHVEGTGIGLMISKKMIEMMGGELGFFSEEGQGSTFWVEMPTLNQLTGDHHDSKWIANS